MDRTSIHSEVRTRTLDKTKRENVKAIPEIQFWFRNMFSRRKNTIVPLFPRNFAVLSNSNHSVFVFFFSRSTPTGFVWHTYPKCSTDGSMPGRILSFHDGGYRYSMDGYSWVRSGGWSHPRTYMYDHNILCFGEISPHSTKWQAHSLL